MDSRSAKRTGQEVHYTSLLTTAVDQLGATREGTAATGPKTVSSIEHRIGAIYALEKLAHDYEQLHWPIMEILCTYVRENAGTPKPPSDEIRATNVTEASAPTSRKEFKAREAALEPPGVDIQAALTVIGRRSDKQRDWERQMVDKASSTKQRTFHLDLTLCHLAKANKTALHFERADFRGACLEEVSLTEMYLEGARLDEAHLETAILRDARLERASLNGAHLKGARLDDARLEEAILNEAYLRRASLN
jgi:hypothetical protein